MTENSLITDGAPAPAAATASTDASSAANTTSTDAAGTTQASADAVKSDVTAANPDATKTADNATKAADGDATKTDDKTKADDAAKTPDKVVPEKYEDFKLPDGVAPNTETMTKFTTLAKEIGLTQEQAQKLADIGAGISQQNVQAHTTVLKEAVNGWIKDSAADKEFGGDKFAENLAVSKLGLDTYGTPELKQLLVKSGLGNHPEIIRAFYRAGKPLSEDKVVVGGFGSTAASAADTLYGKQT